MSRIRELAREPMPGEIRLQWWREVLLGERPGEAAAHPVASALLETISRLGFGSRTLAELIEARRFDIYDEPMANLAELQSLCDRDLDHDLRIATRILTGAVRDLSTSRMTPDRPKRLRI